MTRLIRKNHGRGHSYYLDGDKVDGVTTVLNALPKQLKQWAADISANYAVEHWDELTELSLTKRLDQIRFAHRDALSKAALRGTKIHQYGEDLVHGRPVADPEYLGPAQAYAKFLDTWDIQPVATETPLAHTTYRYGGTADLWGTIGRRDNSRALIDLKTGNVYESVVLQLAGYRYADLWQPDGPDSEQPLPEVDEVFVAQIGADDVPAAAGDCRPGPVPPVPLCAADRRMVSPPRLARGRAVDRRGHPPMTEPLEWKEPPAEGRREASRRWGHVADELRLHPGEWARVATGQKNHSLAANIKRGILTVFRPAGHYEATGRRTEQGIEIYARYVGEDIDD